MYQNNAKTHYTTREQSIINFFRNIFTLSVFGVLINFGIVLTNFFTEFPSHNAISLFSFLGRSSLYISIVVGILVLRLNQIQKVRNKLYEEEMQKTIQDFQNSL